MQKENIPNLPFPIINDGNHSNCWVRHMSISESLLNLILKNPDDDFGFVNTVEIVQVQLPLKLMMEK